MSVFPMVPTHQPKRRPYLRRYFWVRKHFGWGAAICWYEWMPLYGEWAINWGVACKTIRQAKTLRKFLNSKVARMSIHGGVPFETVAQVATGSNERVIT